MIKKPTFIILTALLLFSFIASASASDDYIYSGDLENTSEFLIRPPGDFSFNLFSNPSTGYEWNYTILSGNLTFKEKTFVQDDAYIEASGIGGTDYFLFNLDHMGLVKVKFDYKRLWENSSICTKEYTILVC